MIEHPTDDLAAFALGALEDGEQRTVGAHVADCISCAADADAYRDALVVYAGAAETAAPDLRARIVARARPVPARGAAIPSRRRSWIFGLTRPLPAFVTAALAILLLVSVAGAAQARRDADAYAAALSAIPGARVVALQSASGGSELRGSVVIPEAGAPYVLLRVPAPPSGRAWEAWVLRGGTPLPAGISQSGGLVTITLTAPFASGDGVAVTLEPSTGSSAPTTAPVLAVPRT